MNRFLITLITILSAFIGIAAQETEMEQDMFETMHEGDKAAIVAVHVGAEDAVSRQIIDRFNDRMRKAYPNYDFREAWTSRRLIQKMCTNGINFIPTLDELFSQLKKDGYTHVLIQSSNIVNCNEMQFLRYTVDMVKGQFKQMRMGEPLLSTEADYEEVVKATTTAFGTPKEAHVLMCSGAIGTANSQYTMLDYTFHDKDYQDWFVGTVGGYPSLDSLMKQLKNQKVKKVHLIPFMFTSDMDDMMNEWRLQLQKAGYKVTTEMRNIGELDAIMAIFENHIRHAEKFYTYSAKELKMISR